uniref:Ion transport domain-containing protein n=1 Tax=Arcella intermedia TaxID=1963864 RepID=A0A6B2L5T9_9EUKA
MEYGWEFSGLAMAYQIFQNLVVWLSVINFLISSTPYFWDKEPKVLEIIEKTCVAIFTADYLARLITVDAEKRVRWILRPIQLIDLAAIVPFYIEIILIGANFNPADASFLVIFRTLRLFRMFRTLKIARYSTLIPMFMKALIRSREGFLLFTFNTIMLMIVLSATMFYAEQTVMEFNEKDRMWLLPDGRLAPFQSIPATFWWFLVTIATVGYGDAVPVSDLGKVVASISMIIGLFLFAVPLAVFGLNFGTAWDERQEKSRLLYLKEIALLSKNERMTTPQILRKISTRINKLNNSMAKHQENYMKIIKQQQELNMLFIIMQAKLEATDVLHKDPSFETVDREEEPSHLNTNGQHKRPSPSNTPSPTSNPPIDTENEENSDSPRDQGIELEDLE